MTPFDIILLSDEPQWLPQLADWHHQEWSHINPSGTLQKRMDRMQSMINPSAIPSTFVAKAVDHQNPHILGSAALVHSDMDTHPEWSPWLASVYVAPQFRRQGVGSALVKHVMSIAKQQNMSSLYLFTEDGMAFYQRLGWQILSQECYRNLPITIMQVKFQEGDEI